MSSKQPQTTPLTQFKNSVHREQTLWNNNDPFDIWLHINTNKLFNFGQNTIFDFNHLFHFSKSLLHHQNFPKFSKFLKNRHKAKKSFFFGIWRSIIWDFAFFLLFYCVVYFSQIPLPILVNKLVDWLENGEQSSFEGFWLVFLIAACSYCLPLGDSLCDNFVYPMIMKLQGNLKVREF